MLDHARIGEVLVKMIHELTHAAFHRWIETDVVNHDEMRDEFTKSNAASMRTDWNFEVTRERHDGEVVVDSTNSTTIELTDLHAARRKKLLEHHAILTLFARCDFDRCDRARDQCVTEDVVR